jgi:hypothetical protein
MSSLQDAAHIIERLSFDYIEHVYFALVAIPIFRHEIVEVFEDYHKTILMLLLPGCSQSSSKWIQNNKSRARRLWLCILPAELLL